MKPQGSEVLTAEQKRLIALVGFTSFFFLNIEFLLGRFYAGFFGASIISWCLLISAFVIGFSIGQYLAFLYVGADANKPVWRVIAALFTGCAAFVFLILSTKSWVVALAQKSLPPSILDECLVYVLFVVPITIQIGALSFLLYKRSVEVSSEPVRAISRVLIVGALGSAVGCIGHILAISNIDHFTSEYQLVFLGLALLFASGVAVQKKKIFLAAGLTILAIFVANDLKVEPNLKHHVETPYANFRIFDLKRDDSITARGLAANYLGLWACIMKFDTAGQLLDSTFFPVVVGEYALSRVENPRKILIVGGGEGCQSQQIEKDAQRMGLKVEVDLLDIDPFLPRIASQFFNPMNARHKYIVGDARRWLAANGDQYDAIFVDAFFSGMVPTHLLSIEFYDLLHKHLAPGGAILMDTIGQWGPEAKKPSAKTVMVAKIVNGLRAHHPEMAVELFSFARENGISEAGTANLIVVLSHLKPGIHDDKNPIAAAGPFQLNSQSTATIRRSFLQSLDLKAIDKFGVFTDNTNNSDFLFRM